MTQLDIYGRPLPIPQWVDKPDQSGYYFFAQNKKDWDISRMVAVSRHEWSEYGKPVVKFFVKFSNKPDQIALEDINGVDSKWYGPFRVAKPDWE